MITCVSKDCKNIDTEWPWKILCRKRWQIPEQINKRMVGATTWKQAFEIMQTRQRLPKGDFTAKTNIVFGKGRNSCVDTWLLIGHTVDSRLRNNIIEIKLCIQNCHADSDITISLGCADFTVSCLSENGISTDLRISKATLVATQGVSCRFGTSSTSSNSTDSLCSVSSSSSSSSSDKGVDSITLGLYSYCVIALEVPCPEEIVYETDFLARALQLRIFNCFTSRQCYSPNTITCDFFHNLFYTDHYDELPGGVVLLRNHGSFYR